MMAPTNDFERVPLNSMPGTPSSSDVESGPPFPDLLNDSKNEKIRRQKFEKFIRFVIIIIICCIVVNGIFAFLNYFNSNSYEFQKQIDDLRQKVYLL